MKKARTKRTPKKRREWKAKFLEAFAQSGNVTAACLAAGVGRTCAYDARKDEIFAKAWDEAEETACDLLEIEARRRAHDGWEEPVFYQGADCGRVRKYDSTLLIFLLKAHRPEKFCDRQRLEHSGRVDGQPSLTLVVKNAPSTPTAGEPPAGDAA